MCGAKHQSNILATDSSDPITDFPDLEIGSRSQAYDTLPLLRNGEKRTEKLKVITRSKLEIYKPCTGVQLVQEIARYKEHPELGTNIPKLGALGHVLSTQLDTGSILVKWIGRAWPVAVSATEVKEDKNAGPAPACAQRLARKN